MIKLNFSILFFLFAIVNCSAQIFKMDSSSLYKKKNITFEEANILTSIYSQDGNHSAVTGGVGTEQLTDFSNTLDVKFYSENGRGIRHNFGFEMGIDLYTSASSDNIDLRKSSASSQDVRFYPSLNYQIESLISGNTKGAHLSFSKEYDYTSIGAGINQSLSFNNKKTGINFRANGFYDTYDLYIASELRTTNSKKGREGSSNRNSYDASLSLSQVISAKMQMAFIFDVAYQTGFLSTPFHRVYREDGSITKEVLPSSRFKIPFGMRLNIALNDKIMARSFYRYFKDDWGLKSHTAQLELPIRFSSALSFGPYGRFYTQSGNKYFGANQTLPITQEFVTSDYDLSDFNSLMLGVSTKFNTFKGNNFLNVKHYEARLGYYKRSDGLWGAILTLGIGLNGKK